MTIPSKSTALCFISPCTLLLPTYLDIETPFHSLLDLLQGIDPYAITATGDSDEDTSVFHDDYALEADSAYQCIRLRRGRRGQRQDIETLGMTEEEVVGCEESAAGWRSAEMRRRQIVREDGETEAEFR